MNAAIEREARAHGYGYHEVRRAVNLLIGWGVAKRDDAEAMVERWAAGGADDLEVCARAAVEESERAR